MINQVILMGRLARDPDVRYTQGEEPMAVTRVTLAVERDYQRAGEDRKADFVSCISFGKTAEFIGKYFIQGSMLAVVGSIQTGSYTNKDGQKVYTTDVVVNKASFTGEKRAESQQTVEQQPDKDGFINIPENIDEELPFN